MANAIFPKGKQNLLAGNVDMDANDIRVMLVRSTYSYDGADEFVADLGAVDNGRTGALTGKTVTDGVFDADDTSLTATAANASNALVVFVHTGSDATARLLAYIDTATGLPFTPAASQVVNIAWDAGANKIFAL